MPHRIAFLIYPGFQLLDATGPIAAFEIAGRQLPGRYALQVVAAEPGMVVSSSGVSMLARAFGRARDIDTLVVAGGDGSRSSPRSWIWSAPMAVLPSCWIMCAGIWTVGTLSRTWPKKRA